jgi:FlaA1/EpsC-like NDP-sugar epimerase
VRAGEKLHEELWGADEEIADTGHPKISRARRIPIAASWLDEELASLELLVRDGETLEAVSRLSTMVRAPVRSALWGEEQVEELGRVAPDPFPPS